MDCNTEIYCIKVCTISSGRNLFIAILEHEILWEGLHLFLYTSVDNLDNFLLDNLDILLLDSLDKFLLGNLDTLLLDNLDTLLIDNLHNFLLDTLLLGNLDILNYLRDLKFNKYLLISILYN